MEYSVVCEPRPDSEEMARSTKVMELRQSMLHEFLAGRTATEATKNILVSGGGRFTVNARKCQRWFAKFRSGDYRLMDACRPGRPMKLDNRALDSLLMSRHKLTLGQLASRLNSSCSTVHRHMQRMSSSRNYEKWSAVGIVKSPGERNGLYSPPRMDCSPMDCTPVPTPPPVVMTDVDNTSHAVKPQLTVEQKDDTIKVNGEVNGSYVEEMEVCENDQLEPEEEVDNSSAVVTNNSDDSDSKQVARSQSNGETVEEDTVAVPSNYNGGVIDNDYNNEEHIEEPVVQDEEEPKDISELEEEIEEISDEHATKEDDTSITAEPLVINSDKLESEDGGEEPEPQDDFEDPLATECDDPLKDTVGGPLNMTVAKDEEKTPEKLLEDEDSCIELSPDKSSSKKKKSQPITVVTPRRSSRNLNKTKSYADRDIYIEELDRKSDDDEVEEVIPTDPLADDAGSKKSRKTTIVVNDTKRLVEIAAGSKQSGGGRGGKKEPTLVIIDTNSILSGKGAVAVSQTSLPQMTITPTPPRNSFSMVPINVGSSGGSSSNVSGGGYPKHAKPPPPQQPPKPVILPSLTDDMYVVEAPSFIVPYVYEKPPITSLKEFVDEVEKVVKEEKEREEREAKLRKKKEDEEKAVAVAAAEAAAAAAAELGDGDQGEKMETDGSDKEGALAPSKSDTETDEEVKENDEDFKKKEAALEEDKVKKKIGDTYFDNPLGKFFMQIGVNLVQEFVQTDLLRNQKRKRDRDGKNCPAEVHVAISSLLRTLECSKENNEPFKMEMKKCNLCSFKTESDLVMAHHLETPHMRNYVYRCNFCTMEVRSPHDILFHMEAVHNVRGRLERAPAFHQCPNCPFEDNQKGKLSRHLLSCAKKYKPERNQEPPLDWEPPAKIPRMRGAGGGGGRLNTGTLAGMAAAAGTALYPVVGGGGTRLGGSLPQGLPPQHHSLLAVAGGGHRGRGRPPISVNRYMSDVRTPPSVSSANTAAAVAHQKLLSQIRPGGMVFRPGTNCQPPVLLPSSYQISSNSQLFQNKGNSSSSAATAKLLQQPSISITPLPRQGGGGSSGVVSGGGVVGVAPPPSAQQQQGQQHMTKPGRPPGSSKATFVICEICDGYIKDLEQLRNHMQWIHKVKIHPKMIYNRPPLNCQKCQFRFFTDQGLERHLLGSHGLVTSSMQEAANKGKDGGRCPVCGRVYQWKLLNHVARDHNMSLKPAHLSYKCTVCTATFGMYKQFENHVYSAHSVVAKRVMDKKPGGSGGSSGGGGAGSPGGANSASAPSQPSTSGSSNTATQNESMLKPLKINDEITIIPQPARTKTKPLQQPQKTNKV